MSGKLTVTALVCCKEINMTKVIMCVAQSGEWFVDTANSMLVIKLQEKPLLELFVCIVYQGDNNLAAYLMVL